MNYDPYFALAVREMAEERAIDLNRETAPDMDGIAPANVPIGTQYRVENNDGTTNPNATANALCAAILSHREAMDANQRSTNGLLQDMANLREENENLRAGMCLERADNEKAWEAASELQEENERLRERATNAETLLRAIREGWDRHSTGMTRLGIDLILGNPEATEPTLKNVA